MSTRDLAEQFVRAFASRDAEGLGALLDTGATLRIWDWQGAGAHRPIEFVLDELAEQNRDWIPGSLDVFRILTDEMGAAVDFRVQTREGAAALDQGLAVFIEFADGKVATVDLHASRPLPAAERGRIFPASLSEDERRAVVAGYTNRWDIREIVSPNAGYRRTPRLSRYWTKLAHPGTNFVRSANWSADEADARIGEVIAWFRERGMGIQWMVGPDDRPNDLGERLVKHGFVRAGDQVLMARFGIDDLDDIAINPEVEIIDLKIAPRELWEASLQINATAFQWPLEQVDNERQGWFEEFGRESTRSFMALLDGKPVADAHLYLESGVAYLGGAATLPEYRNRKIYSTLFRGRLALASDEGYEVAMIHAEPMSRRVVAKFGFQPYATFDVYGWMEPMDLDVIATLVQDQ